MCKALKERLKLFIGKATELDELVWIVLVRARIRGLVGGEGIEWRRDGCVLLR